MPTKPEWRKQLAEQRASLDPDWKTAYDKKICERLEAVIRERGCRYVHTFIPMGDEIDIRPLLRRLLDLQLQLITTKTLTRRRMQHLTLLNLEDLGEGIFGTRFPLHGEVYEGEYDLILVPGLGFTREGSRLGYGGGYYDTFLADHPRSWKLAPAYPFQVLPALPLEDHDVPVDQVLILDDI